MKRTNGERIFNVFNIIILTFTALISVYPLVYTLSLSLSSMAEASKIGFHIYPKEISLAAYKMVLAKEEVYTGYFNTVFRTVFGTVLTVTMTSMMAYPLSKPYMPNSRLYTLLLIFTMVFDAGMVPGYLLIKALHLQNNRLVYILPGLVGAYNIIVVKSYFKSLPASISESARIDGANEFGILFRIIMPLSKPVLATVAMWVAVAHWNTWIDSMLYMSDKNKQVLQIFLQRIVKENQSDLVESSWMNASVTDYTAETVKSATIIVSILPILLVYPFIQKYFVKGIMLGSVKG